MDQFATVAHDHRVKRWRRGGTRLEGGGEGVGRRKRRRSGIRGIKGRGS